MNRTLASYITVACILFLTTAVFIGGFTTIATADDPDGVHIDNVTIGEKENRSVVYDCINPPDDVNLTRQDGSTECNENEVRFYIEAGQTVEISPEATGSLSPDPRTELRNKVVRYKYTSNKQGTATVNANESYSFNVESTTTYRIQVVAVDETGAKSDPITIVIIGEEEGDSTLAPPNDSGGGGSGNVGREDPLVQVCSQFGEDDSFVVISRGILSLALAFVFIYGILVTIYSQAQGLAEENQKQPISSERGLRAAILLPLALMAFSFVVDFILGSNVSCFFPWST